MNNNTKAKFKRTNGKTRSIQVKTANPRGAWNKHGKVASKARKF